MASVTIDFPDNQKDRILTALCGAYGYQEMIDGQPNPETAVHFCKRMIALGVKQTVVSWEANEAQRIARETAIADGELLNIT